MIQLTVSQEIMNELRMLYDSVLTQMISVRERMNGVGLEGPLLMAPTNYFEQPFKLLIVGQETGGWHCEYDSIDEQLQCYQRFNVGTNYRSSPFWNITRKAESALGVASYSCAWTNLNRFDYKGKAPPSHIQKELIELDFIVKEEIRILRPDACLFYTNRKNDYRLRNLYEELRIDDIDGLPKSHFAKLSHPELPRNTFRTPHPKSMRLRKTEQGFIDHLSRTREG